MPMTQYEIDLTLKGIDDCNALGLDGFSSLFFKRTWNIIKTDMYQAIMDFFY